MLRELGFSAGLFAPDFTSSTLFPNGLYRQGMLNFRQRKWYSCKVKCFLV